MRTPLQQRVLRAIKRSGLIVPGDRVGAAVSGGADSVALLRLLEAAREDLGITLTVVHFDHKLRQDSASDARFVEELAREAGLAYVGGHGDVAKAAARNKWNVEDAARRLRYEFFADVVSKKQATKIAVAHTMDDQAETVLARMLRGAGPAGLAGIYPANRAVVRPLLGFRRATLREYLGEIGQPWREDATNRDLSRQRVRIRENLLPVLERDFSPRAVEHLATLARLSHEENHFWSALVEDRFRALATKRSDAVSISAAKLSAPLEIATEPSEALGSLTERLVRRLYESVPRKGGELSAAHVEYVLRLARDGSSGKQIELPGGVTVVRNFGDLIFRPKETISTARKRQETRTEARAYQYQVQLKQRGETDVSVPELDTCFRLKVIDCLPAASETTMWRSILDLNLLRQPLVLRSWRPGDSYRPLGRRKARKLKEMFLRARVAADERLRWPVLECDGHVVWARGMEPAGDFCAGQDTRVGVLIEECKL
jgi:tRNA(Ile)-lysidine synthase